MTATIHPSRVKGTLTAPPSKSAMQRACALAYLHEGQTTILNPGKSDDDLAALQIIRDLGATVDNPVPAEGDAGQIIINSPGTNTNGTRPGAAKEIHCGESGLSLRMFTPIAALSQADITITGRGSLLQRPVGQFDELFPQLSVQFHSNQGKLPLHIKGPLVPADITIDGSLSSQFVTGLLMAFAAAATKPVTLTVTNPASKPYIDLTLQLMKHFGYAIEHQQFQRFLIQPQTPNPKPQTYFVEGDWSSASFLLVAGAIAGEVTVNGLDRSSGQADKAMLHALEWAGAGVSVSGSSVTILKKPLTAFHFDATECPDLFPPLVALALHAHGTTVIKGVHRLAHKESDRALTLMEEFGKMGADIHIVDDSMLVTGTSLSGATVHSRHDHRIAMACAVAALNTIGATIIEEAEAVNKSYPDFYLHLKMLGADVSLPINYNQ